MDPRSLAFQGCSKRRTPQTLRPVGPSVSNQTLWSTASALLAPQSGPLAEQSRRHWHTCPGGSEQNKHFCGPGLQGGNQVIRNINEASELPKQ